MLTSTKIKSRAVFGPRFPVLFRSNTPVVTVLLLLPHVQVCTEYHGVCLNNFTAISGSDIEGRLAVGGNLTASAYSVSATLTPPDGTSTARDDLVVCGVANFASGAVLGGGNFYYVDPSSYVPDSTTVAPPGVKVLDDECPVDFIAAVTQLFGLSDLLASQPRTGTATKQYS